MSDRENEVPGQPSRPVVRPFRGPAGAGAPPKPRLSPPAGARPVFGTSRGPLRPATSPGVPAVPAAPAALEGHGVPAVPAAWPAAAASEAPPVPAAAHQAPLVPTAAHQAPLVPANADKQAFDPSSQPVASATPAPLSWASPRRTARPTPPYTPEMDIATSGVADDARIADEEEAVRSSSGSSPLRSGDATPASGPAAEPVWLAEPQGASTADPDVREARSLPAAEIDEKAGDSPIRGESAATTSAGPDQGLEARDLALSVPDEPATLAHDAFSRGDESIEGERLARDRGQIDMREGVIAGRLEDIARRIRAGDLRPLGSSDDPSDAAALAAVLAALLDRTR